MKIVLQSSGIVGELFLEIPGEILKSKGWKEGDTLDCSVTEGGAISLVKQEQKTELILVETVSKFRIRYLVEVPIGKKEWAEDTVVLSEVEQLGQTYLGEDIISSRVISKAEAMEAALEDNECISEDMMKSCIKKWYGS
jgi:bifunctional DNA-binding transcriptional regulator/antitoxin component of YhaV-PrlF toxin-antitoxin module